MNLIPLGTSTFVPEIDKATSCYLVKTSQNIVFDFGRGALNQLLKAGIHYYDIDAIFITHMHPDHINDLSSFLHLALVDPLKKRKRDMTIYGPLGFKEQFKQLLAIFQLNREFQYQIIAEEISDEQIIKGNDYTVQGFKVEHMGECLSYRINSNNKTIVYSGDTSDCPGIRKACQNADIAVLEANNPSNNPNPIHLTPKIAAKIAKETGVKQLVLTHIAKGNKNPLEEAKKVFEKTEIAKIQTY